MPSMRALMTAGVAAKKSDVTLYNCAYLPIDNFKSFDEEMFILMCGTGVGYSVETMNVKVLPIMPDEFYDSDTTIIFEDSRIGWAKGYREFLSLLQSGQIPKWDVSKLRPAGARLKTMGGRSSGPQPLVDLMEFTRNIFTKAAGRQLTTLECHDIACKVADIVVVGGVRRSALISLSDLTDSRMREAKSGNWWLTNPHRRLANNSAVYDNGRPDMGVFMKEWLSLYESHSGERGIVARKALKKVIENANKFRKDRFGDSAKQRETNHEFGTNPSLRKGTKVWTTKGIFSIEELENTTFEVKNLSGNISEAKCWLSGKNKRLYKIKLKGGHEYFATKEHQWPIIKNDNTIEKKVTTDIKKGDFLPVIKTTKLSDGIDGDYNDGFIIGWNLGDGWISERETGKQIGFIVNKKEKNIAAKIQEYLENKCDFKGNFLNKTEINVNNAKLRDIFEYFNVFNKSEGLPKSVWKANISENFRKGLIDGLFSSDGSVENNGRQRIVLTSVHEKLINDVSELLGFYGIKTTIKKRHHDFYIANKKRYEKEGVRYDLNINNIDCIEHFKALFTLSSTDKQNRLNIYVNKKTLSENKISVVSVEETDLYESVWDISVKDETHCFQLSHCITGNCSEIILRPYEFCNLTSVQIYEDDTEETIRNKVRLATILGTFQSCFTNFKYLNRKWQKNCEDERLLGVSLSGIYDNRFTNGKYYNNYGVYEPDNYIPFENGLTKFLESLKEEAITTNLEVASAIGIASSVAITCVKPEGCLSLDTKIKTSDGIQSMAAIFGKLTSYDIFEIDGGTWLEPEEDLYVYDENNQKQLIKKLYVNGMSKLYEIEMEDGVVVKLTAQHQLKTNNGWIKAKDLTENDEILSW